MPLPARAVVVFSACALAVASGARAQDDRHRVEAPVRTLAVTSTREEVGIEYNYYGETIRQTDGGRIRYTNHYLQEYVQGRANGYVYHPRFATFSSMLKFGMAQQWLRRTSPDDSVRLNENDELIGYDFKVDFLPEHAISGTLEARRDERILMGLFVDRYRVETESQRGSVRWRGDTWRMDATAAHTETEEFGAVSQSSTTSDSLVYNAHHSPGPRLRTDLRYALQSYERRFRGEGFGGSFDSESSVDSQTASLTNRYDFTNDRRISLRSTLRYHQQESDSDLRSYYWQERLDWQHTPNLSSYVTASALRNEFESSDTDTLRGEAGLDHQLYRSLRSHVDLHGRHTDFGGVTENRIGPTARFNYRKETGAGVLSAGYARTLDYIERSGGMATNQVFDEEIAVNFATPVFLDGSDVVADSIVVTDTANQLVYTEGFDYEVVVQGSLVGIRALPGGLLAPGETVFVDYRQEVDGDLSYIADDQTVSIRHDFDRYLKGLAIYAMRHDLVAREVQSETDARLLEYVDQSVGLRQQWRQFAFTSEYQDYSDDLSGYNQWRNQLEGNHRIGRRIGWGWNVGHTRTNYETETEIDNDDGRDDDRSRYTFAGTHLDGTFARSGFWRLEARTVRETGRTEQTVHGILAKAGFDWRRLSFEGGARFESYDIYDSERDRVQVFVSTKWRLAQWIAPGEKR